MASCVQVGQQLGNYRLLRQLGKGGFAEVYLGEHQYLQRFVAVKVLLVSLAGDDKESDRFLKEAQTMASLKHPHIVSCLDFGIQQNIPYLVMDYAPGGTLRDWHPKGDQVPLSTVVSYVEQVADALQYAHQRGMGPAFAQEARMRIRLALGHKLNDHLYQDAAQMIAEQNMEGAQQLLQQLYAKDQYYGDPLDLGKKVKVRVPLTYQQEQAQREKEEARRDRQDEAEARQKAHPAFAEEAYGEQWGKLWLIWIVWFVFVSSVGATIGAVTQSWFWALIALLIAATGGWGLGYRRVLALLPLAVVFAVSLVLTLGLTLSLARLDYAHPYPSAYSTFDFHAGKNVIQYHYLFLRRQLNFGLIWWAVTSFVGVAITFFLKPPYSRRQKEESSYYVYLGGGRPLFFSLPRSEPAKSSYLPIANLVWITLGIAITGLVSWAWVAFIAGIAGDGFSIFDVGANTEYTPSRDDE